MQNKSKLSKNTRGRLAIARIFSAATASFGGEAAEGTFTAESGSTTGAGQAGR
jgi:hypothetical protein